MEIHAYVSNRPFGNISSTALLLVSKLNSNMLGHQADFHLDICSVSTCVWIQIYPNNSAGSLNSAVYIKQARTAMAGLCSAGHFWEPDTDVSKPVPFFFFLVPLCTNKGFLIFKCEFPSKRAEENIPACSPLQREGFYKRGKKKKTSKFQGCLSCGSLQSGLCRAQLISGSTASGGVSIVNI